MIYHNKYTVGIEQAGVDNQITDRSFLAIMEDIASLHSASVGYGLMDIETKHRGWILLDWQLEIIKRPKYNETLDVYTWSRKCERAWAYRDFEFKNEKGERVAIGTSRWILFDTQARRPLRITEDIGSLYHSEPDNQVFGEEIKEIKYAEIISDEELHNISEKFIYRVLRRDIDINEHMHNINYLDIAYEALPQEIYENIRFNTIRVQYKKEIKHNDEVVCYYLKYQEWHLVLMCVEDKVHALVALK